MDGDPLGNLFLCFIHYPQSEKLSAHAQKEQRAVPSVPVAHELLELP